MEIFWEYARAFLCGGVLCLIGQVLIDKTKLTPARILVLYVVRAITPVPGGVGAVTTTVLARHVLEAAARASGLTLSE